MISFLKGQVAHKAPPLVVIDVNGVGYEVQASMTTFAQLPATGNACQLLTHFVVREDAQLLFGFASDEERKLFRALIKISGVGPKLALAILSGMGVEEFGQCISDQDIKALVRLPGVGKKTAERLVIEMKDRLEEWGGASLAEAGDKSGSSANSLLADAESALIALGYSPAEASKSMSQLDINEFSDSETLIRAALKSMLRR